MNPDSPSGLKPVAGVGVGPGAAGVGAGVVHDGFDAIGEGDKPSRKALGKRRLVVDPDSELTRSTELYWD